MYIYFFYPQPSSAPGSQAYVDTFKEEWREVFLISAEIYIFGALVFLILASGQKQWWADGVKGNCTTRDSEARQELRTAAGSSNKESTPA